MKNTTYFLSALLVLGTLSATLVGCSSGWNQDPLAQKDKVFQDGREEPKVGEKPKGIGSDEVRLDKSSENPTFAEAVAGEFVMKGRILQPGYTATLYFDNIADFPGARFDAVSGKFTWTPALGTVSADSLDSRETKILKVKVVGNKPGAGVLQQDFQVKIDVNKVLNAPEILSVSNNSLSLREGDVANITVRIRDKDAGTAPASWPIIQAWPVLGYANISQFVTVTNTLATGNNEFNVTLKIDLTNAELTNKKGAFGFSLQAISRFQRGGMQQTVYVNVLTSFANLKSTWFDVLNFSLGVKDEQQFLIYDPKEELAVGTPVFTGAPAGASFSCSAAGPTSQLCKMVWAPDFMASAGDFTVRADVVVKNQDPSDTATKNQSFDLKMRVNSAPPISPVSLKEGK